MSRAIFQNFAPNPHFPLIPVNVCPQGLHADAIPEYVYFGTMLATMTVDEHDQCLQKCAEKPRCKAVNFFHPFAYQEKGFCELLTEGQLDNPSLMRPFRKATYYEKIRCRELDDVEDVDEAEKSEITESEFSIFILFELFLSIFFQKFPRT